MTNRMLDAIVTAGCKITLSSIGQSKYKAAITSHYVTTYGEAMDIDTAIQKAIKRYNEAMPDNPINA